MLKNERERAITFINKAIELDKSLKVKADEEPIFIPIRRYIELPKVEEVEEINDRVFRKNLFSGNKFKFTKAWKRNKINEKTKRRGKRIRRKLLIG